MKKHSYSKIGEEIGNLVDEKQEAYGDSFGNSGKILKILYPNGVQIEQYDDLLAIARIIDKLFRIANKKDAFGESPYRDIAGYALLGIVKHDKEKEKKEDDVIEFDGDEEEEVSNFLTTYKKLKNK